MSRHPDAAKRKRILEAAYDTFGTLGFQRAKLKDIAERAGLAPGTIYTYFTDKSHLFREAVEETWDELHEAIEEIRSGPGSCDVKLAALEEVGLDLLRKVHPVLHAMFSEAVRMDLFSPHLDRLCEQIEGLVLENETQNSGEVDDHGRFLLHTFAYGILLQVSIVPPEQLDATISTVKQHLRKDRMSGRGMSPFRGYGQSEALRQPGTSGQPPVEGVRQ